MELINSTKSALKKPNANQISTKKVSFSEKVKLFIDDPEKAKNANGISRMKWVEINIVDKSHNIKLSDVSPEDCKISDFQVHKVVYDNCVLSEPEEDNDSVTHTEEVEPDSVVFDSTLDEGLEFIVHKVTDHEDELIEKELEFNDTMPEGFADCAVSVDAATKGPSELSVKNIIKHDKIIAFIDQKKLSSFQNSNFILNKNIPCKINDTSSLALVKNSNRIGLSPPLQELSLEKIVRAHSDNILGELDISPLNSVQETDSDSDLSSEGTMIMMTTEECERNEQHIRESLLKYKSIKEEKVKALSTNSLNEIDESLEQFENDLCDIELLQISNLSIVSNTSEETESSNENENLTSDTQSSPSNDMPCSETSSFETNVESAIENSISMSDIEMLQSLCEDSQNNLNSSRRGSLIDSNLWDKSLTSIEIPKDVREWKILIKSFEKNADHNHKLKLKNSLENARIQFEESGSSDSLNSINQVNTHDCDELENFVNQNNERVERIRKRYLASTKNQSKLNFNPHYSIKEPRPQFGSTAQILHLMQKQNNPPFYTYSGMNNHMSWPCADISSDPNLGRNVKHKHSSHVYVSQSLSSDCSSQSSFDSDEHLNCSSDQISFSSCQSILAQERGRPEGASPPRPGSEDCFEQTYDEGTDGLVYYSMKV